MNQPSQSSPRRKVDSSKAREKIDRIPISKKSTQIIKATIEALTDKHPGIELNRKDFVNWVIEENFSHLTPTTEKQLFERFYDEIKFLEKSLKTLKQKKKNGEDISISKVLKQANPKFRKTDKPKPRVVDEKNDSAQGSTSAASPRSVRPNSLTDSLKSPEV